MLVSVNKKVQSRVLLYKITKMKYPFLHKNQQMSEEDQVFIQTNTSVGFTKALHSVNRLILWKNFIIR